MDFIQNKTQLATTPLRQDLLQIINAGLNAIQPNQALTNIITRHQDTLTIQGQDYHLADYQRIFVCGIGKASFKTAAFIETLIGDKITDGVIIDVAVEPLTKIRTFQGTHPIPSQVNIEATDKLIQLLQTATENDLVISIISGGGSALLCSPNKLDCQSLQALTDEMLKSGANIGEINTLRKHISQIHGGGWAKFAYPATVIGLIFSDIPDDDISIVASGPTYLDNSTIDDAQQVIDKYHLNQIELTETPKEQKYFDKVTNILVVSNQTGLAAMADIAKALGYQTQIISHTFNSDTKTAGEKLLTHLTNPKMCILAGGETTSIITGHGMGGRNQEVALAALQIIQDYQLIASVASDGKDNIKQAAGAIADSVTLKKSQDQNLVIDKYLADNDSYHFFEQTGDLIVTGVTGANVSDFLISLSA